MAMAFLGRAALIPKPALVYSIYLSSLISRSFSISSSSFPLSRLCRSSAMLGLRPLTAIMELRRRPAAIGLRCFSTHPATSSLKDPSPTGSNRPPKETVFLDGCDFEHWMVVVEPPEGNPTRDEIIDSYIKTLAEAVGSEEEARMKIYSVSTRHYYAFGCLVSEELSHKIKSLPRVRWVIPDSYLDVRNKDYGGEPFINGQAVPYDPKYHEEGVRNNARADERSRRNDRPRNFDRSRNLERHRESRDAAPIPNRDVQHSTPPRDIPVVGGGPNRDMGPSGGYQNMPPSGPAPPNGGYSNMPNSGGPSGGNSNMPPGGGPSGPSGGYSNMPPSGGLSSGYSNMLPGGGQSGGYSNMPPIGGPSGGYSNMLPSGRSSGRFSNMLRSGGPSGGYSNMPNTDGLGGRYSNVPNSGGPNEGYSNMPSSGGPSRELGGMQNRGYPNSYVHDRDVAGAGNTYPGSNMPGRDL